MYVYVYIYIYVCVNKIGIDFYNTVCSLIYIKCVNFLGDAHSVTGRFVYFLKKMSGICRCVRFSMVDQLCEQRLSVTFACQQRPIKTWATFQEFSGPIETTLKVCHGDCRSLFVDT